MGSLQADSEKKQEMNDSGIQEESPPSKRCDLEPVGVQLLDLSDDVLLLILRFLSPRDLKAVGFTCPRLGALVLDRSLWQAVDARGQPWGRARLRWFLSHALHAGTRTLLMAGYARETTECPGHENDTIDESVLGIHNGNGQNDNDALASVLAYVPSNPHGYIDNSINECGGPCALRRRRLLPGGQCPECPRPRYTLAPGAMRQIVRSCPALHTLALDYCNINCKTTNISQFPHTLKELSLRGSKCFNLSSDRSFLFKIQDTLHGLEILDVSQCDWMEPASLLPLSKLPVLRRLFAQDCHRLTEFVAYASLATRYGFTKLEWLDLRGSPVGDSEVSALGWLAKLTHLWLSPAKAAPAPPYVPAQPTESWETRVPFYYRLKEPLDYTAESEDEDEEEDEDEDEEEEEEDSHTWRAHNGTSSSTRSKSLSPQPSLLSKSPSPSVPGTSRSHTSNGSNGGLSPHTKKSYPKAPKRKNSRSPTAGPSKRSRNDDDDDSDSSDDDNVPLKALIKKSAVNEGASTSKAVPKPPEAPAPVQQDIDAEPRHHVLYVNVGQQLHAVYRLSLDYESIESLSLPPPHLRRANPRRLLSSPGSHIDASSLITDSAIRRFGRADGEDINYINIGPNGPYAAPAAPGSRPDRSSLTHLTVTGFRHITDRSLEHLATSAPNLQFLDFSETRVTDTGVRNFRSLRPECEVRHSKYVERKED